jgi:hypothetical protein
VTRRAPLDLAELTVVASSRFELSGAPRRPVGVRRSDLGRPRPGHVLRPRDPGAGAAFEVNAATARLVRAVRRPQVLRDVVHAPLAPDDEASVTRLVLDGVLEIEVDGRFVSGLDAWAHLYGPPPRRAAQHRSTRLTLEALAYGERLMPMPVTLLAYRLYRFNTIPASPRWRARFPSSSVVSDHLGIPGLERQPRFRERGWVAHPRLGREQPWLSFTRTTAARAHALDAPMHKLYVSPEVARVRDAFQIVARLVVRSDALAFKVGGDVFGVLRPDKLVVYFASRKALMATADALHSALRGLGAHGVPFTAPLDEDGLISCGVDPPPPADGDLMGHESWRLRVAARLAASLAVAAASSSGAMTAPQFALARLSFDGIDLLAPNGSEAVRRFAKALRGAPR